MLVAAAPPVGSVGPGDPGLLGAATWSASTPIRAPVRWLALTPGLDEEAHSLRIVPGQYFCPASDDALHHPKEAA